MLYIAKIDFVISIETVTTDKEQIVEKFNDYFANIAKIVHNVKKKSPTEFKANEIVLSLFVSPVTEIEINVILMSLK